MKPYIILAVVAAVVVALSVSLLLVHTPDVTTFGSPVQSSYGNATTTTAQGSSGATITFTGATGRTIYVTDIAASVVGNQGDLLVKDGSTIVFQEQVGTSTYVQDFNTPIKGTAGNSVTITISGSSTVSAIGYFIP